MNEESRERRNRLREILNQARIGLNFANSMRFASYEFREQEYRFRQRLFWDRAAIANGSIPACYCGSSNPSE